MWAYPDPALGIAEDQKRLVQFFLAGTFADEQAQTELWQLADVSSLFLIRFTTEHVGEVPPVDPQTRPFRDYNEMREVARDLEQTLIDFQVCISFDSAVFPF
jgi:hypothetical protein